MIVTSTTAKVNKFLQLYNNLEPMLFVDVNVGESGSQRIVVYEGDKPEDLAEKFAKEHNLD